MRTIHSRPTKSRTPKLGRPKGGFTQHRRLDRLRAVLENSPLGLTLEELAVTLKVTERSVRRYLRELDGTKPEAKYEQLEYVETKKGGPLRWRIKPGERGRAVSLRRAQAYALLATRRSLEVLRGSALYDEADLALSQIAKVAQTPFRASERTEISGERRLEDRFFFVAPASRSYLARGEELDELFRAVADLRVLRYRPRTRAGDPRPEAVRFHPYAMVVHDGAILLVGAKVTAGRAGREHPDEPPEGGGGRSGRPSRVTNEIDVVSFDAMTDLRSSETEQFELPEDFDVGQFVHGVLGVGRPPRQRFIVEFEARVGDEVKTRRFHPQQRIATAPDGRVRLSLPLVDARAAIEFVLTWGDSAKVVEPPELAREVGSILARAAARYGGIG